MHMPLDFSMGTKYTLVYHDTSFARVSELEANKKVIYNVYITLRSYQQTKQGIIPAMEWN